MGRNKSEKGTFDPDDWKTIQLIAAEARTVKEVTHLFAAPGCGGDEEIWLIWALTKIEDRIRDGALLSEHIYGPFKAYPSKRRMRSLSISGPEMIDIFTGRLKLPYGWCHPSELICVTTGDGDATDATQ